jgi:hypothetical protein
MENYDHGRELRISRTLTAASVRLFPGRDAMDSRLSPNASWLQDPFDGRGQRYRKSGCHLCGFSADMKHFGGLHDADYTI